MFDLPTSQTDAGSRRGSDKKKKGQKKGQREAVSAQKAEGAAVAERQSTRSMRDRHIRDSGMPGGNTEAKARGEGKKAQNTAALGPPAAAERVATQQPTDTTAAMDVDSGQVDEADSEPPFLPSLDSAGVANDAVEHAAASQASDDPESGRESSPSEGGGQDISSQGGEEALLSQNQSQNQIDMSQATLDVVGPSGGNLNAAFLDIGSFLMADYNRKEGL